MHGQNHFKLKKNIQMLNLMKTLSVGTELFRADGRAGKHDETDGRFTQFCY
jgi:hypothetical protein